MILAFSGWMDGGNVSVGTVEWFVRMLGAAEVAYIEPEEFLIYNFPGSMEIAALFRPETKIEDGLITEFKPPANVLFCSQQERLLLLRGQEPNFRWSTYADCLFSFAEQAGVTEMYFVGSVGGTIPHTREARLHGTVSEPELRPLLARFGIDFSNYEGPAAFATQLLAEAPRRGVRMTSLVAEIPAYIQGPNPKCIDAVVRKLSAMLELPVPLDELRALTQTWEERVNEALAKKKDLLKYIRKLEEDYDNEVFDTQMGDLKEWLEQQGIRVD